MSEIWDLIVELFFLLSKVLGYGLMMSICVIFVLGVILFIIMCISELFSKISNEKTKKYFKKICRCIGVAFGYLINIYALFCICYAIYDYFFK